MLALLRGHAGVALLAMLLAGQAYAQSALPDPDATPGAINPDVTQANIDATICVPGWTRTVRPAGSLHQRVEAPAAPLIRSAMENAGVEFIDPNGGGAGVRLKAP